MLTMLPLSMLSVLVSYELGQVCRRYILVGLNGLVGDVPSAHATPMLIVAFVYVLSSARMAHTSLRWYSS